MLNVIYSGQFKKDYKKCQNRDHNLTGNYAGHSQNRVDMVKSLFGILSADITLEEAREKRLSEKDDIVL